METDKPQADRTRNHLLELMLDTFRGIEQGNAYALATFEADGEPIQEERLYGEMRYKATLNRRKTSTTLQNRMTRKKTSTFSKTARATNER